MSWNPGTTGGEWESGDAAGGGAAFNRGGDESNTFFSGGSDNPGLGFEAGGEGGGGRGACFNCGQDGHNKADCPEPAKPRACFNCGEEGHSKADCVNPSAAREFTGTCRTCEQVGHRAADCPSAPVKPCTNCKLDGHSAMDCKNPRVIDRSDIEDIAAEHAWTALIKASVEGDLDEMKAAVMKYVKANPDTTFVALEHAFRVQDIGLYIIAIQKELAVTYTNMDLQGNLNKTFSVTWRKSPKPARPKEQDSWPTSPEENLERLLDAGEPVERGVPKCTNCDQLGHTNRSCPEDKIENTERASVKCYNCDQVGHRVRDCPDPRPDKFACRNCKQSGHSSKECPVPRSAEGVECKKCSEIGHFSRDCPLGGGGGSRACFNCGQEGHSKNDCTNDRVMICRNCDEPGHTGKECPKPRDYSRVKCQNCQQMGHTKVRCPMPLTADEDAAEGGAYAGDAGKADFGGNDDGVGDLGDHFKDVSLAAGGDTGDAWGGGGGSSAW